MTDKEMMELYEDLSVFVSKRLDRGYDPIAIAPIMIKLGLEMYKTVLDKAGYDNIVDFISESRDEIKTINTTNVGGLH